MRYLQLAIVILAVVAAAAFLALRWKKSLSASLDPDRPDCCAGCSGCPSTKGNKPDPACPSACPGCDQD